MKEQTKDQQVGRRKESVSGFLITRPRSLSAFPYEYLLIADDGEDYYLTPDKGVSFFELEDYLDTKMSFTGSVAPLHRGFKLLTVADYESLETLTSLEEVEEGSDDLDDIEWDWLDHVV